MSERAVALGEAHIIKGVTRGEENNTRFEVISGGKESTDESLNEERLAVSARKEQESARIEALKQTVSADDKDYIPQEVFLEYTQQQQKFKILQNKLDQASWFKKGAIKKQLQTVEQDVARLEVSYPELKVNIKFNLQTKTSRDFEKRNLYQGVSASNDLRGEHLNRVVAIERADIVEDIAQQEEKYPPEVMMKYWQQAERDFVVLQKDRQIILKQKPMLFGKKAWQQKISDIEQQMRQVIVRKKKWEQQLNKKELLEDQKEYQ
ncbi:MAG: hypothetical protein A2233_04930 [Candidatus Kerfeldbacteria bacterium RIFOXYA2_FULL_38_24]|uniref:Uncharacterized protein n=1 Tax=Candidatus Kerfeldbacteria bacterium RIFOXYB2_FULL_38_14 TaxID=1798547 RepID=A0A1G2BAN9_9BACT|nr:MAG: hypothetical protein A2233_04930 [Candidatus Kerfeldbacteria bacterium RIFOXYA2_FULL_38_24]OGY85669.1 MAG: hypothetical protein A2319_05200 [Candidatus Kerfeldbacteria bacterium RIFOXYB2_FULL_38_14]OGY88355.1 MAG: hypothetical protein A2458_02735 [Candidatus Kerfeldbacteria bacterium RIFOXYC2_FULL_38_9]